MNEDQAIRAIINKELEPYGVDMDYVIANPKIEDKDWFHYYTFKSQEEYDEWKKFVYDTLTKKTYPRFSKKRFELEFPWIDLMWGLKHDYT